MSLILKKQLQLVVKSLMTIINRKTELNIDIVDMMAEEGIIDPVSNSENVLYTDNDGKVYVL